MRIFGAITLLIGIAWASIAFNMDTSITTEGKFIGSGAFRTYIEPMTVNNLGLMARRSNHLTMSGVAIISGVLLLIFSAFRSNKEQAEQASSEASSGLRACPFCAESIKKEAKICRFCQRDVPALEDAPKPVIEKPIEETGPEGTCPGCSKNILLSSKECKFCKASFDEYSSWKIAPK